MATLMTFALLLAPSATWGMPGTELADRWQENQPQEQAKPWTDVEYQAFYTASSEANLAKKTQLLEQFLSKYPESALAHLVKRTLAFIYIQNQNLTKAFEVADSYFGAHNEKYAEAFKFAYGPLLEKSGVTLPTKPTEDFDLLINLIVAANGAARNKITNLDSQTMRYLDQASSMIKSGSVPPTMPPARWNGNEKAFEATLQQTAGLIKFNNQKYDEALEPLQQAGELTPTDPVTFYLWGESLRLGKYAESRKAVEQTRQKYNELSEQLKPIEEQVNQINTELEKLSKLPETPKNKARIQELTQQGEELNAKGKEISDQLEPLSNQVDELVAQTDQIVDKMIRVYAKTVALTDKIPDLQKVARPYLESYYKYRHNQSLDGLPELIQRMRTELP
jgi:tetratricopeptide (TPR) repeat protein